MYKHFKKPEVPTSSPDRMTFPFEFSSFQFTMENFVKSFTRNRVTKENLSEVMEEVNAAVKPESDSFKAWDYFSLVLLGAINGGMLACILTLQIRFFVVFAIKLAAIFIGLIMNFVIWSCYLSGTSTRIRDKIQAILDTKDEYFDSKGMRWTVCSETEFPYWIELHIQSQFEIMLQKEKEKIEGNKKPETKENSYSEARGIMQNKLAGSKNNKGNKKAQKKLINLEVEDEDFGEEEMEQQDQPQPKQEVEIDMNNKQFNRLYAPLEEDYEENYEDEEGNN